VASDGKKQELIDLYVKKVPYGSAVCYFFEPEFEPLDLDREGKVRVHLVAEGLDEVTVEIARAPADAAFPSGRRILADDSLTVRSDGPPAETKPAEECKEGDVATLGVKQKHDKCDPRAWEITVPPIIKVRIVR
jgi:hypothetical protein